jgi:hypothetical protein
MYARDAYVEVFGGRHAHRVENRRSFERDWNVRGPRRQHRNGRNAADRSSIPNRDPRRGINRRQPGEHLHLLLAELGRDAELILADEQLAQMRNGFPRAEHHLGDSSAALAMPVPANVAHDASSGSDRLPLWSPARSSATKVNPAFRQARCSSVLTGSSIAR